jgi:hypothetical protein
MTEQVPANPEGGAEPVSLTVDTAAERLRGMLGGDATENTEADDGNASVEGAEPQETEEAQAETDSTAETETEEVESPETEEKTPRYTVKVNGEEKRVTLDELKKGFQLEADYRQKTSQLAEQRRQLEAERGHYGQQLKALIPALQSQLQDKFGNVDWVRLSEENPTEYVKLHAEATAANQRLQLALAEQQRIEKQTQHELQANYRERLKVEAERLSEKLPEYSHPEKGKALREGIRSYLKNVGYTDDELKSVVDHKAILIADKARRWDEAQKAKTQVTQKAKAENVPKVQKPGTPTKVDPKSAAVSAANERFRKSGRTDDLAAVLRAMNRS